MATRFSAKYQKSMATNRPGGRYDMVADTYANILMKIIDAGNTDFLQVYGAVYKLITESDKAGCTTYKQAVFNLPPIAKENKNKKQCTTDPSILYQQAAIAHPMYGKIIREIINSFNDGVEASLPSKLKNMARIVEKCVLKRNGINVGNANKVCDIVRGMITCRDITKVAEFITVLGTTKSIVITRVKDRFFDRPSGGGWRDCMINFFMKDDPNQHICEIQIVHAMLLTARRGLPGHAIYNRVRNASELLAQLPKSQPKDFVELTTWIKDVIDPRRENIHGK